MKTVIEMAREAGFSTAHTLGWPECYARFAELVREQEREACAELVYNSPPSDEYESPLKAVYDAIRARGNT